MTNTKWFTRGVCRFHDLSVRVVGTSMRAEIFEAWTNRSRGGTLELLEAQNAQ